jgi:hypothetical protein
MPEVGDSAGVVAEFGEAGNGQLATKEWPLAGLPAPKFSDESYIVFSEKMVSTSDDGQTKMSRWGKAFRAFPMQRTRQPIDDAASEWQRVRIA